MQKQDGFAVIEKPNGSVAQTREMQSAMTEVQSKLVIAKKFPRDESIAYQKIIGACQRYGLAAEALYSYPRGGQRVEGPSIDLARAIAQRWGNLDYGTRVVEQGDDSTRMEAYCWDLETNVCERREFNVPHVRKARGAMNKLTDPRDVYELTANMGSRRLRACILGVIPGDIVEAAVGQVNATLKAGPSQAGNFEDRSRKMLVMFGEVGVTKPMIEKYLSHKFDSISPAELARLGKVYKSIRDGIARRRQFFEVETDLASEIGKKGAPDKKPDEDTKDDKPDAPTSDGLTIQDVYDEYGTVVDKVLKKAGKKRSDFTDKDAGMLADMCLEELEGGK